MQIVKATLKANPNNSVIGFKDNSSAIRCSHHILRTAPCFTGTVQQQCSLGRDTSAERLLPG